MNLEQYLSQVEEQGGDPEMYWSAYLLLTNTWTRPNGWRAEQLLLGLFDAGVVESRLVYDYRANGSVAYGHREFRRRGEDNE